MGTGWIGWTEEQTLNTTMPGIESAHRGRVNMLQAIFGKADEPSLAKKPSARHVTPKLFDALFFGKR